MVTYYVVQGFSRQPRGSITADNPQQMQAPDQAIRAAQRLAGSRAGVIAFSRTGDPASGDWDDAVVLFRSGHVPAEMFDLHVAS